MRYQCKCCGYYTLSDKPLDLNIYPRTFEVCPVCFWEDDSLQFLNPNRNYGPNGVSLHEAKKNYKEFGAIRKDVLQYVRKPRADEEHSVE